MTEPTPFGIKQLHAYWPDKNPLVPDWVKKKWYGIVAVQGCITGIRHIDSGSVILTIDDAFGTIPVKLDSAVIQFTPVFGEYVRVTGRCQVFRRSLQLNTLSITRLDDSYEGLWAFQLTDHWRCAAVERRGNIFPTLSLVFSRSSHSDDDRTIPARLGRPPDHFRLPLFLPLQKFRVRLPPRDALVAGV